MRGGTHTFLPTERVHFGPGSLDQIKEEARAKDLAFVVTGRSLSEKTDLVRRVEKLLGGKHGGTFSGMGQHTPGSSVEEATRQARGSDLLVSVGGGSVVDGTKAVARELGYPTHVAVPTTLSGAEWAHRVGVTDEESGRKGGFADPRAVPQVVVLDPETTLFTPEKLWLSTGIRALDHAVEGLLYGGEHPVTDVTGAAGRRLARVLRAVQHPDGPLARAGAQDRGQLRRPARVHLLCHPRAEPRGREKQGVREPLAQARGGPRRGPGRTNRRPRARARATWSSARRGRPGGGSGVHSQGLRRPRRGGARHTEVRVLVVSHGLLPEGYSVRAPTANDAEAELIAACQLAVGDRSGSRQISAFCHGNNGYVQRHYRGAPETIIGGGMLVRPDRSAGDARERSRHGVGVRCGVHVPSSTAGGVGREQGDSPPLRPDRGQGEARVHPLQEPLVARATVRDHSWAYHEPHTLRAHHLRDLLRPLKQQAGGIYQRRGGLHVRHGRPPSRGVLPEALRRARSFGRGGLDKQQGLRAR